MWRSLTSSPISVSNIEYQRWDVSFKKICAHDVANTSAKHDFVL